MKSGIFNHTVTVSVQNKNVSQCAFCLTAVSQKENPIIKKSRLEGWSAQRLQKGISFLDNWLTIVSIGILAIITTCLLAVGSHGFTVYSVTNTMQQFCLVGSLSIAALISTRTGGLDLSVGSMMALSSVILAGMAAENNTGAGFLLSLVVCGALGLMNGLYIMVFRIPAILVTAATTMLIWGIAMWAGDGKSIALPAEWSEMNVAPVALIASVVIAILVLCKAIRPIKDKANIFGEKKFFWIYGLVAVIGVFAGWATAISSGTSDMSFGSGSSNEMVLLFVFAMISGSKLFKNNWVALCGALVLAMLWTIHDQAMILLELNPFSMIVSNASWVIIMLTIMTFAKRNWKNPD